MGYISHDGENPFVRLGPDGAFDSMMIYMGVGVLPMPTRPRSGSGLRGIGDELRLYYTGYDQPHDKVPAKNIVQPSDPRCCVLMVLSPKTPPDRRVG